MSDFYHHSGIVISALDDQKVSVFDTIDEPMLCIDAPRPSSRQIKF